MTASGESVTACRVLCNEILSRIRDASFHGATRCQLIDRDGAGSVKLQPFGVWRSPVARLLWEQDVESSNPSTPTIPSSCSERSARNDLLKPQGSNSGFMPAFAGLFSLFVPAMPSGRQTVSGLLPVRWIAQTVHNRLPPYASDARCRGSKDKGVPSCCRLPGCFCGRGRGGVPSVRAGWRE